MPHEEVRALRQTRDLLRDLIQPYATPRVPKVIRDRAARCLRHYPFDCHIVNRWADDVCECGDSREFCDKCRDTP